MGGEKLIKSVAVIGAGASGMKFIMIYSIFPDRAQELILKRFNKGSITAAALKAENYFDRIRVFERRETAGGTWIFDPSPGPELPIQPGKVPPEIDPPLDIPNGLPRVTAPCERERFSQTPVYNSLTTNVPDIAMCFSDQRFSYGPFPPHHVPRLYLEHYVAVHKLDEHLVLSTTVEDVSKLAGERWQLTLRKHDVLRRVDVWWTEEFDALIIANGHYSVPFIPHVDGLDAYTKKFPGRVVHSKYYRDPSIYAGQRLLTIGNSASGWDIMNELTKTAALPVLSSRRHKSPFEGDEPPPGIEWKGVIRRYRDDGTIEFEDGSTLGPDEVDKIIYATGYRPSFPFWNVENNGRQLYDYEDGKLVNTYWHTFFSDFKTLGIVGIQRALTFRSFEYQAVALARLFAGRNKLSLPPVADMKSWEANRLRWVKDTGKKYHDIESETGHIGKDTFTWLGYLYELAGLGTLQGDGRIPPVLSKELLEALKTIHKYPPPDKGKGTSIDTTFGCDGTMNAGNGIDDNDWIVVRANRD